MNPYKTIWRKTSETVDYLLIHGLDKKMMNLNFLIAGLATALQSIGENNIFDALGPFHGFVLLIALTGFAWLLVKYLLPFLYLLTGKIWSGRASLNQVMLIMSLSLIPEILYLSYMLITFALSGEITEVNYLVRLVGWLFSVRILVIGLSKVQGFSYGLSLLNVLFPIITLGLFWSVI